MISLEKRIEVFSVLGKELQKVSGEELDTLFLRIGQNNPWFKEEDCKRALTGIAAMLDHEVLLQWMENYSLQENSKHIGVVMAGNIPAVGFHDYLSILISGNKAAIKLSSQDQVLLPFIHNILTDIAPQLAANAKFVDKLVLNDLDVIIATGSDNSARYFESYFKSKPSLIRKNRTSVAILRGDETKDELLALGKDILDYYGLGCRNISKLYVPQQYDFTTFFESIQSLESYVVIQNKYVNNYDYNKAIVLVNGDEHLDNGFLLLKESKELVSPIGVVFYEEYERQENIDFDEEKIQCKVGKGYIDFGSAQCPKPWDYADGIDIINFLTTQQA